MADITLGIIIVLCLGFLLFVTLVTGVQETERQHKEGLRRARWVYVSTGIILVVGVARLVYLFYN